MDEQQDLLQLQGALAGLDEMKEMLAGLGTPISLTMPDGSTNYMAVLRIMRDPEYQDFRDSHPEQFGALRNNFGVQMAGNLLQTTNDLAKLGFALSQIKRANNTRDRMPLRMRRPDDDQQLNIELSDLQQDIEEGLNRTDRSLAEAEDDRAFNSAVQRAQQFSGGQAASAQANAQSAARARARRSLLRTSQSQRARMENRAQMRNLLGLRQQQIDRGLRVDQFNNQQDMKRFAIVNQAKTDLMRAGYENAFNAGDALFQDLADASAIFQDQMPGFVYRDNLTEDASTPLNAVFNNPVRTMQTGTALFGPAQYSDIVGQGYNQAMDNIVNQAINPLDPQNMYL